jgi:hypothetical protein
MTLKRFRSASWRFSRSSVSAGGSFLSPADIEHVRCPEPLQLRGGLLRVRSILGCAVSLLPANHRGKKTENGLPADWMGSSAGIFLTRGRTQLVRTAFPVLLAQDDWDRVAAYCKSHFRKETAEEIRSARSADRPCRQRRSRD